jgi:exosortase E/protease (VPEID-CTERM system)
VKSQLSGTDLTEAAQFPARPSRAFLLWIAGGIAIESVLFVVTQRLWAGLQLGLPREYSATNPIWVDVPWTAFKLVVFAIVGWCALFWRDLVATAREHARRPSGRMMALHLLCLVLLLAARSQANGGNLIPSIGSPLGGGLVMAASGGYFFTLMRLTSTQAFWARHHPLRQPVAALALGAVGMVTIAAQYLSLLRDILSPFDRQLFGVTISLTLAVLHSAGYEGLADSDLRTVDVGDFGVQIAPFCLGYEGFVIALIVIGVYIFINRRDLLFPHCLAVFPVVAGVLFVFNGLRIATLLAIGAAGHPEVAVDGFHSTAGTVVIFGVIGTAIVVLSRFGRRSTAHVRFEFDLAGNNMQLLPWLTATSLTVAFGLVFAGVDWWYPARVVIVSALLFRWRGRLRLDEPSSWWLGPAAGVGVFALWLALVPHNAVQSAIFEEKLFASSAAAAWIIFRVIGASVIVPVVEELAFRGFLLDRAAEFLKARGWPQHTATWAAVAASAIVFGVLHSAWVAGILAGVAYAAVRLYRGRLADAVLAHAVTNLLLSAYVLNTGSWSYW